MSDTKNDKAWKNLFYKYNIIDNIEKNGVFEITSEQINEFREARLMTKFDHKSHLPKLFTKNKLSILPITRGSYTISKFDAYKDFEELNTEITRVHFPEYIESIDYENITSEATALNCAYASLIISDFMDEGGVIPAVSGRMSSLSFEFTIDKIKSNESILIKVTNSQIEIDGGFEGYESLAIIEAKNNLSEDFLIRQLYYPYRLWQSKVRKKVRPIFMTYSNDIFSFYEYKFQNPYNYNSLVLIRQKNYLIEQDEIKLDDIIDILHTIQMVVEPHEVPSPQANNFKRVINLCEELMDKDLKQEDIYTNYDFVPRQADYYVNAGRYLGLIDKSREGRTAIYSISELGKRILNQKYRTRQLSFVKLILSHKAFNDTLKLFLIKGEMPPIPQIMKIMKEANMSVVSEDTFKRRAESLASWINWIFDLI